MDETNWGGGILFTFKLRAEDQIELQAEYMGRITIKQEKCECVEDQFLLCLPTSIKFSELWSKNYKEDNKNSGKHILNNCYLLRRLLALLLQRR